MAIVPAPRIRSLSIAALCALLIVGRTVGGAEERGWLGIYSEPVTALPAIETDAGGAEALRGAACGLRVTAVVPDSPADQGGLLIDDIIVALLGDPFTCPPESVQAVFKRVMDAQTAGTSCTLRVVRDEISRSLRWKGRPARDEIAEQFWHRPQSVLDSLASGDSLEAAARMRQRVLDLVIELGPRPEARWRAARPNEAIYPSGRFEDYGLGELIWALADSYAVRGETEDLLERLGHCHDGADPFRLECMIYAHRDPTRAEAVARYVTGGFASAPWSLDLVAHGGGCSSCLASRRTCRSPAGYRAPTPPARSGGDRRRPRASPTPRVTAPAQRIRSCEP